ncbi:uncharacterized protein TNCV_853871 [Trichonephila clavipes]|nr:uncharacterized protein TNCV_853871 [Trichonephila clavipes]
MKATTLVNGDRYRAMITNFFIPELNNQDVQELWFQQDGATCHTVCATIDLLKDTFGDRLIYRFGPVNWSPRSCDLTPLDYFLKPIAQPTEDMQIKDEPTEEIDAVGLRIPKKHSTDKSADAVKIAGPPSDKVPDLIEPVRDLKTPDEQKNALVKEILRNACAMFTPLVSPFFYFSNNTYKPEVIVQDLIIKPDFNGQSSMSVVLNPGPKTVAGP